MRIIFSLLFFLILPFSLEAQVFNGIVKSYKDNHPLDVVSVVAFDSINNPIAFKRTDENGRFLIEIPQGKYVGYLTFSSLGYATKRIAASDYTNGSTVLLKQEATNLKEVVVKSNRLYGRGDTLVYSVAGFMQKQDRSIADVIAKMPGLEVTEGGQIKYHGKPINKFYIEGMDLTGSKYSIASNNLSATKVKNVQVLKNHQPVKSLRGVKFSDDAALNIELSDDAKDTWNGSAEMGLGMQLQKGDGEKLLRDGRLVAMMFSRKTQSISMYKWNNTGKSIQDEISDLTSESGFNDEVGSWINDISISAPSIKARRYRYNDTRILATNWLRKLGKDKTARLQGTYLFDKTVGYQYYQTVYNNIPGGAMIDQESDVSRFRREATINMQYKLNSDKTYFNNVVKGEINWNQSDAGTSINGTVTHQMVQPRKRSVSDDFKFIRNISKNRSVSLSALASYQYLPGLMALGDSMRERINLTVKTFKAGTGFRHKILGFNVSYLARVNYKKQEAEVMLQDTAKTYMQHLDGMLTPMINYEKNSFSLSSSFPFIIDENRLDNANDVFFHVDPQISLSYQISSFFKVSFDYDRSKKTFQFSKISPISYYSSYINRMKGNGKLMNVSLENVEASLKFDSPLRGIFSHITGSYLGISDMPLMASSIDGSVYETTMTGMTNKYETYRVEAEISQSISLGKLSFSLGGSSLWNKYQQLISEERNRCVTNTTNVTGNIAVMPVPVFSLELNSSCYISQHKNLTHPEYSSERLKSFEHQLRLFFMPKNWKIEWVHELYHSNDESVSTNYFSDFRVSFRHKRREISVMLSNIFGTSNYCREMVTDSYRQYSVNHLRPREILANISFYL